MKTLVSLAMSFAAVAAMGQSIQLSHTYQIESTGTYKADNTYYDFGSYNNGQYLSFGATDFNGSSLMGANLATANLTFTDASYSQSHSGTITVWAVTDNTTSLAQGQSTITYNSNVSGGYSNQLGTPTELGTYTYTVPSSPGGLVTIPLTMNLSAITALASTSNHVVRFVYTGDGSVYFTMNGVGSSNMPAFNYTTQSVPEPASFAALAVGVIGLVTRKRRITN